MWDLISSADEDLDPAEDEDGERLKRFKLALLMAESP
jgi:hypothetical protein